VLVQTPQAAELADLLHRKHAGGDVEVDVSADRLSVRGTTTSSVSQLAFDNHIRVVEIAETSRSLEEILLDITGSTAEFASA
jgi:ABC-2 type transport system ATP-binding protein